MKTPPTLRSLLEELTAYQAAEFDAPDDEGGHDVDGGDAVQWLTEFRLRARQALDYRPTNGAHLYDRYLDLHETLNSCECDSWDEVDQSERDVWSAIAEEIAPTQRPEGLQLSWAGDADMSHWLNLSKGNCVKVNGTDYVILRATPRGLTLQQCNDDGDAIGDATTFLTWPQVESLHIY